MKTSRMGQGIGQGTGQRRSRQAERGSPLRHSGSGVAAAATAAGPLSEDEVEALRAAYAAGARGAVLIGLRQVVRVITVHLPEQASEVESVRQMGRAGARLRLLRCDGYIHIRRSLLRAGQKRQGMGAVLLPALIVDERIATHAAEAAKARVEQRVVLLDWSQLSPPLRHCEQWRSRGAARLTDAVSQSLEQALSDEAPSTIRPRL